MPVFELRVEVAPEGVAALEELLAEAEEQQLMVLEDKPSGRAWLAGYFQTEAAARAAGNLWLARIEPDWIRAKPKVEELPDRNWRESYREHFHAWRFGRLNWVPEWERNNFHVPEGEAVIWLDPGMAFGTGNHETTRLCVERLMNFDSRQVNAGKSREHLRVIDAGCGSGILALSAARLGYGRVTAFDHDPEAISVCMDNARRNDLAGGVEFFAGDLATALAGRQAELVLANIQSDVLMRFADELLAAATAGGELVLSGILRQELPHVDEIFGQKAPAWPRESRRLGEWVSLVLQRPN